MTRYALSLILLPVVASASLMSELGLPKVPKQEAPRAAEAVRVSGGPQKIVQAYMAAWNARSADKAAEFLAKDEDTMTLPRARPSKAGTARETRSSRTS